MTARAGPGFWTTVVILLGAARRRAAGRLRRQAQLRRKRGTMVFGAAFGSVVLALFAAMVHVFAALDLAFAVAAAQGVTGGRQVLPDLTALAVLGLWSLMLVCQGEAPETDMQRGRHPMWEWLFSHPAPPPAIFLAEMISPITANPIFTTAPVFAGVLFGRTYGVGAGALAALLAGVPATVALACLGKAIEINIVLRLPAATRGAALGVMAWLGMTLAMLLIFLSSSMAAIVAVAAPWLAVVPAALVPPVLALTGAAPEDGGSLWQGIALFAAMAAVVVALAVAVASFGARDGLVGATAAAAGRTAKAARFGREPLYTKELLWLRRDRRALVQALLVPLSLAAVQTFNLRGIVSGHSGWSTICGLAILFGTYFLLTLGPQSLASEGTALWIAQTWPRGLESLLKAKAKLWSALATIVVGCALAYAAVTDPHHIVGIVAVFAMWLVFGRSLAEKTVTLATVASSSGEQERIPAGRRWAALLGTFAFASGVFTQQWSLAITGVVYSVMTAAAMWQNFRFRLPYLSDPWSEVLPPAPTLMHAMIAIAVMVELASVAMGMAFGIAGREGLAVIGVFVYAISAIVVALVLAWFLASRDVAMRDIFVWRDPGEPRTRFDAREIGRTTLLAVAGAGLGAALAGVALLYLDGLHHWPELARSVDDARRHLAEAPDARNTFYVIAVFLVPTAEEFLFRGLLYRALDREWGGWRAVAGAAAFFAIYHPLTSWLPVGALGAMNALLFKRSGRLAPAIAAHMAYNAVVLLPTFA